MSASPEWMKGLDQAADDAQDQYDPEADQQAELAGYDEQAEQVEQPAEQLALEGEQQTAQRVEQQSQMVPLATLLEERKKLQQAIDEERARAARFERLEDELRNLRASRQQPTQPEAPKPQPVDYLEDPKAYVDQSREQLIDRLKKLESNQEQVTQAQQMQAFERAVTNATAAAESEFVQENPDYYDALAHLRHIKAQELELLRPDLSAAQRREALKQGEIQFAALQLQAGRNPSEAAYKMASALGYVRQQEQNRPNGQDQAAAKGVDRRRLQGMGGGSARAGATDSELDRLMEGGQDEFDQAMSELFPKRR